MNKHKELKLQELRDEQAQLHAHRVDLHNQPASREKSKELERIRSRLKTISIRLSPTGKRRDQRSQTRQRKRQIKTTEIISRINGMNNDNRSNNQEGTIVVSNSSRTDPCPTSKEIAKTFKLAMIIARD